MEECSLYTRPQVTPTYALLWAFASLCTTMVASFFFTWRCHPDQFHEAGYMISHTFALQPGRGIGTIGTMFTLLFLTWMHNDLYMLGIYLQQCNKIPKIHENKNLLMCGFCVPTDKTFKLYNTCALWFARTAHLGIIGIVGVSYIHFPPHALFFLLFVIGYLGSMCFTYNMYIPFPTITRTIGYIQFACICLHFIGIFGVIYLTFSGKEKEPIALFAELLILLSIVVFFLSLYTLVETVQIKMHINTTDLKCLNCEYSEDCADREDCDCSNMPLITQKKPVQPKHNPNMYTFVQKPTRRLNILIKL